MKRVGIFMSLLALLAAPTLATTQPHKILNETVMLTELPWSTVQAVFKKVADQGHYTYNFLINGYDAGTVTVAQSGSSYFVTIRAVDGASDQVIIDSM